jgi:hypothetical protein
MYINATGIGFQHFRPSDPLSVIFLHGLQDSSNSANSIVEIELSALLWSSLMDLLRRINKLTLRKHQESESFTSKLQTKPTAGFLCVTGRRSQSRVLTSASHSGPQCKLLLPCFSPTFTKWIRTVNLLKPEREVR